MNYLKDLVKSRLGKKSIKNIFKYVMKKNSYICNDF